MLAIGPKSTTKGDNHATDNNILLGDHCARRVFFPASALRDNADRVAAAFPGGGTHTRTISQGPVASLGLFPSPYVLLKKVLAEVSEQGYGLFCRIRLKYCDTILGCEPAWMLRRLHHALCVHAAV